jgi:hypothetical protein
MFDRWFRICSYKVHIAIESKPHFFGWSIARVKGSQNYIIGFCLDRLGIDICRS